MRGAQREAEAERLWVEACALEDSGEIERAIELYRTAAKLGFSYAQINLANLLSGYVTPPKMSEAIYWLKRAIRAGEGVAAFNLALDYKALGKRRWYVFWLRRAAEMGDEEAIKKLKKL